jgi:hypothetical protein
LLGEITAAFLSNQQQKGWKKTMTSEAFQGEYIIDEKAFDDNYMFLDIETYLYRGIEEAGFGENRNLEYLVNMQNRTMMVLENEEILFGMKMTELTKDIIKNKPDVTVYRYSLEIDIYAAEYEFILEAARVFLEKSTDEREDKKFDYKI